MSVVNVDRSLLAAWEQQAELPDNAKQPWLDRLRDSAKSAFQTLGFPTTRDEAWRFTNVTPLTRVPFQLARGARDRLPREMFERAGHELPNFHRLVFVNGRYQSSLSTLDVLPDGVVLSSLSAGSEHVGRVAQTLGRYADYAQHAFTALNTACLQDVAVLILPQGAAIDAPIHFLYVSLAEGQSFVSHPRVLVVADARSRATILESFVCHDVKDVNVAPYFTNAVTEILLGENAAIEYCRLQDEHVEAFHVGTTQVHLSPKACLNSHVISCGGKLARHELNVVFDGESSDCSLNGLTVAHGRQLIDHQTHIDHVRPNCTSREFYKAVVGDYARGVFSGKIHVHPGAHKTDARQTNHTLLLSDDAVMDTQPQLEIYADDVKCTHGASVGSLDEQAVFYLRSRGIGANDARHLLTFAFANEILQRISAAAVRNHAKHHLELTVAEYAE